MRLFSMNRLLTLGLAAVTLAFAVVGGTYAGPAGAHRDPPGTPIKVTVEVIGVATDTNQDDGLDGNAELEIDHTTTHANHPPGASATDVRISDNYNWDVYGGLGPGGTGGIQTIGPASSPAGPIVLYTHDECTPMDQITVDIKLEEDDTPGVDDNLGRASATFTSPGTQILQTAAPDAEDGTGRVEVRVRAEPQFQQINLTACSDGITKYRGLLINGDTEAHFVNDVAHLKDVLAGSTNWVGANATIETMNNPTPSALIAKIENFFKAADDDDVSLFFFSDHGCKDHPAGSGCTDNTDTGGDEPANDAAALKCGVAKDKQCDEDIRTGAGKIVDDALDEPFKTFIGDKVIVLHACYSGGMKDGAADLPVTRSTVLTSSNTNQVSWLNDKTPDHEHGWFPAGLIAGLAKTADNYARADVHGNFPETADDDSTTGPSKQKDGKVTVLEWFKYADAQVQVLRPTDQDPEINDAQEPAADKSASKVIFQYANAGNPNDLKPHAEPSRAAAERAACLECPCPTPVGGIAETLVEGGGDEAADRGKESSSSPAPYAVAGAVAAAVLAVAAGGWYARRRWLR